MHLGQGRELRGSYGRSYATKAITTAYVVIETAVRVKKTIATTAAALREHYGYVKESPLDLRRNSVVIL